MFIFRLPSGTIVYSPTIVSELIHLPTRIKGRLSTKNLKLKLPGTSDSSRFYGKSTQSLMDSPSATASHLYSMSLSSQPMTIVTLKMAPLSQYPCCDKFNRNHPDNPFITKLTLPLSMKYCLFYAISLGKVFFTMDNRFYFECDTLLSPGVTSTCQIFLQLH